MEPIAQKNASEVARIRANIEAECEALQHMTLFACTASHDIIQAKFKNLDACHQELRAIVAIYNNVVR